MKTIYRKEYNEILELLKHIPSYDYFKIPDEKIGFFKTYSVKDYDFKIDDINSAKISKETYVIYTDLYKEYIATEDEKIKIDEILKLNKKEKEEKYNPNNLFKKIDINKNEKLAEIEEKSFIKKLINKIKSIFK